MPYSELIVGLVLSVLTIRKQHYAVGAYVQRVLVALELIWRTKECHGIRACSDCAEK